MRPVDESRNVNMMHVNIINEHPIMANVLVPRLEHALATGRHNTNVTSACVSMINPHSIVS